MESFVLPEYGYALDMFLEFRVNDEYLAADVLAIILQEVPPATFNDDVAQLLVKLGIDFELDAGTKYLLAEIRIHTKGDLPELAQQKLQELARQAAAGALFRSPIAVANLGVPLKAALVGARIVGQVRRDADPDETPWRQAKTLTNLRELTAQWLEGKLTLLPAYFGGPAEETLNLVETLAQFNRLGYMTNFSQPGEPTQCDSIWTQRAAVGGFCDESVKDRINNRLIGTDLVVLASQPGEHADYVRLCISREGVRENTWVGGPQEQETIDYHYGGLVHPEGVVALKEAWQLQIIDPIWGRNDVLWPAVLEALTAPPPEVETSLPQVFE